MPIAKIPLPTDIYKKDGSIHPDSIGARLVDGYINEFGNIVKRPGMELFADLGVTSKIDGLYWWDKKGVGIAISGGRTYKLTSTSGGFTDVTSTGDLLQTGSRVSFANIPDENDNNVLFMANGGKMVTYGIGTHVTNGGNYYFCIKDHTATTGDEPGVGANWTEFWVQTLNPSTTAWVLATAYVDNNTSAPPAFIADADAPTQVTHVAAISQYMLALEAGGERWYHPESSNPLAWRGVLDSYAAQTKPDDLLALHTSIGEVILHGKNTIEFWYEDVTGAFSLLKQATIEMGIGAAGSVAKDSRGRYVWLTNKRRVAILEGRTPRIISGPFDDEIRDIAGVTDGKGMVIDIGRREFYVLSFSTENITYVCDLSTEKWAEWGNWNSGIGSYDEFICNTYAYSKAWNLHLLGSTTTGKIYKMNTSIYQDEGNTLRTALLTGHVSHGTMNRKSSHWVKIRAKRGVGGVSDNEPVLMIRYRDENDDWSNWFQESLGKMGEHNFILTMWKLGTYRTRQWEIAHAADSPFILIDMEEEFEVLNN